MLDHRIDYYPTHEYQGYKYRIGRPIPLGATLVPNGVNFSIFSSSATRCTLVLFNEDEEQPFVEIPLPSEFRIGQVFAITVFDLDVETLEYGFRFEGPNTFGNRFDSTRIVSDPYGKLMSGRDEWGKERYSPSVYPFRSKLMFEDFDWEGDTPPGIPFEDLIIYELHVRGFTRHPSSGVAPEHAGTFAGLRKKIPYLKELGINCVELMPIFEFDELEIPRSNPLTGEKLLNYWGYSTTAFFAPKAGFAATGKFGMQGDELKALVKDLHKAGIEVILDVVFNHTAEGDHRGRTLSFRGIDNKVYYMLAPDGSYFNFSGCGNTMNCNHPVVRQMVRQCLQYWVAEYHIDGFRFDLASALGRSQDGSPMSNPPLLESLSYDPILANVKLIAEAWDAAGLYQVGSFPGYGRWAEWNGKYRDDVRRFLKSDAGMVGKIALRIQGSPDLYDHRSNSASINFITCHDGFTLNDLVSYNTKHNEANGEENRDGANDNYSWNCGVEGETRDTEVHALRERQIKNAFAILLTSQGVPMLYMGDEMRRTQYGNNNAYCHDTEWNWLDWSLLERHENIVRFVQRCIEFRKAHPVLRNKHHFRNQDYLGTGKPDITFHGIKAWQPDWADTSRTLAYMLCGGHAKNGLTTDDDIYVGMNMYWEALWFELPELSHSKMWHVFVNTGAPEPFDIFPVGREPVLENQRGILLGARSVVVLLAR
ncbi:MAG: glycogen debranching protein GlgX [Bacteroidota bacterium]|nr:glycogen debranching protein GlgX [Candidatus Kapabacteria bacterium]MDW8220163.1 glycogen debranching protein GlgX [Bacteroidota bacterium]